MADPTRKPVGASAGNRSPFEGHQPFERPSRDGRIGVRLSAGTISGVTQIATWPSGIDALIRGLRAALGLDVPLRTGDTVHLPQGLLVRSGPEEFMLLSKQSVDTTTGLCRKISADIGSVTDLSHARCLIHIEGERCCDTLSKLFALDLRDQEFPLDLVRLTGQHHVPCMLHRRERDAFDIYVFSTYAYDQLATLIDAGLEYGVALRPF